MYKVKSIKLNQLMGAVAIGAALDTSEQCLPKHFSAINTAIGCEANDIN